MRASRTFLALLASCSANAQTPDEQPVYGPLQEGLCKIVPDPGAVYRDFPEVPNIVVEGARLTSLHGEFPTMVSDRLPGGGTHIGVDLASDCGSDVHSFGDGQIERIVYGLGRGDGILNSYEDDGDWFPHTGYALMIRHDSEDPGKPLYSTYLHLQAPPRIEGSGQLAYPGQAVSRGQEIGTMGNTGASSGCHTHFELKTAPHWGGQWRRGGTGELEWNIYGLSDIRSDSRFSRGWIDPIAAFCQLPAGLTAGQSLETGCADIRVSVSLHRQATTVTFGERVPIDITVQNQNGYGLLGGPAAESWARVRLTPYKVSRPRSEDPLLATFLVPPIAPGGQVTCSAFLEIPTGLAVGHYKIWVTADVARTANQHPSSEDNDQAYARLILERRDPDLVAHLQNRSSYSFFSVRNAGKADSRPTTATFRVSSSNSHVSDSDPLMGVFPVPALAPGGEYKKRLDRAELPYPSTIPDGRHFLWLIVDEGDSAGQYGKPHENDRRNVPFIKK